MIMLVACHREFSHYGVILRLLQETLSIFSFFRQGNGWRKRQQLLQLEFMNRLGGNQVKSENKVHLRDGEGKSVFKSFPPKKSFSFKMLKIGEDVLAPTATMLTHHDIFPALLPRKKSVHCQPFILCKSQTVT